MTDAARIPSGVTPPCADVALYQVRGVPGAVQAELRAQLEAVVAFADYCVFLTAGSGSTQAAQLVQDAEALHDTTMETLRRHGSPA